MDAITLRETDLRAQRSARIALLFLIPTLLLSSLLTLSPLRATGCPTYGEDCGPVPVEWLAHVFHLAALLGVLAAVLPQRWLPLPYARYCLVGLHVAAQVTMAAMILSHA